MKGKSSVLFVIAFFLAACEIPGAVLTTPVPSAGPAPAVTPGCISTEPTQNDIDRTLSYGGGLYSGADWLRSYTVEQGHVYASWSNGSLGALVFAESLIFQCGYVDSDLDGYFSDSNWNIIFANYESYQPVSECRSRDGGLRLYQFTALKEGYDYAVKYWVRKDTATRVMEMMIVFPSESQTLMDGHSAKLFPELTSCP